MGLNLWPQQKPQQILLISGLMLIALYIFFGVGIWAAIFAILIGLVMGAFCLIGKGQSLKFVAIFYGAIWIFLKIVNSGGRRDPVLSFLSLVCLFTIIGAVITYFILKNQGYSVVSLSEIKDETQIPVEIRGSKSGKVKRKVKKRKSGK